MRPKESVHPFLFTWGLYTLILSVAVAGTDQLDLHREMHPYTSGAMDLFFSSVTHLADGLVPTILALILLFAVNVRAFLLVGMSCGLSAIIVQALKRVFAYDRPFMFKEQLGDMHWVEGLQLHHHLSFPSGHATAAFSMCFALAVLIDQRMWSLILALVASILAYSRVYLSQHFTEDILAGAALGTITAYLVHRMVDQDRHSTKGWLYKRPFN